MTDPLLKLMRPYMASFERLPTRLWFGHLLKDLRCTVWRPPMIHSKRLESRFGTWVSAFFCRDISGRLLGENTCAPDHPSIEWRMRRFSDNRAEAKFNHSAMSDILSVWDDMLADASEIRSRYLKQRLKAGPLSWRDLYFVAHICTSVPAYLVRKAGIHRDPNSIPMRIAALYKVAAGVHATIWFMIEQGEIRRENLDEPADAQKLYKYGDDHGRFMSATGHACAGSRTMILNTLTTLIHGEETNSSETVAEHVGDVDLLLDYGRATGEVDAAIYWFTLSRQLDEVTNCMKVPDVRVTTTDRLGAMLLVIATMYDLAMSSHQNPPPKVQPDFGGPDEALLRANTLQREIERCLGLELKLELSSEDLLGRNLAWPGIQQPISPPVE